MISNLLQPIRSYVRSRKFTKKFLRNVWGDLESRSGEGSNRASGSVRHSLRVLSEITERYGVTSVADIPCGDVNWIGIYLEANPRVGYVGYDIVRRLIAANRERFPARKFELLDIVVQVPASAELVFCKDLFNHLERHEIFGAIANMRRSGSTWLLASNNFGHDYVALGKGPHKDSRHIDLTMPPFRFPAPIWNDHYLGLWKLPEMEPRDRNNR